MSLFLPEQQNKMSLFIKIAILGCMSCLSIYLYYSFFGGHGEEKNFMLNYMSISLFLYALYKVFHTIFLGKKTKIHAVHLISIFLIQLFVLSICFFTFLGGSIGSGILLFFKITFLLSGVAFLWLAFYALGKTLCSYIQVFKEGNIYIQTLVSLGLGFVSFMMGIFILASMGFYNIGAILLLLVISIIFSYRAFLTVYNSLYNTLFIYKHDVSADASFGEKFNTKLLIDEFHYLIVTFLLSINFISVYRPFPIGWDDLGAYMNIPKLLSQSGGLLELGQMYMWQLYTGIGFLIGSQTFAFYLNSFSGVICAIVIYLGLQKIIKKEDSFFNIPLFCVLILLSMPMTIFQLAKDMKLDYGLLTFSVIAISTLYYLLYSHQQKKSSSGSYLSGILIVGGLIGFAFSIKLTSLLLLIGALALIFYRRLSLLGFAGFLGLFMGIFTYLGLWKMMNVVVEGAYISTASLGLIITGALLCVYAYVKDKKAEQHISLLGKEISCILLGFIIALLPWGIKHYSEKPVETSFGIFQMIGGYGNHLKVDFTNIYSEDTLQKILDNRQARMDSNGTTQNEDFGRYFGYEKGINNYLKLPWNLTFQLNQKGEFTDITYLFFALLPALFLFLPYKRKEYVYPVIVSMGVFVLYCLPNIISREITQYLSYITLPLGYIYILGIYIIPFIYFYYTLDRTQKLVKIFLANFAFASIYVFLWNISAFGIVWYGILMYFTFLIMISISLIYLYKEEGELHTGSGIVLFTLWVYIFVSIIPHGIKNIRSAGHHQYKLGYETEEIALFKAHREYLPMLFSMNVSEEHQDIVFEDYKKKLLAIVATFPNAKNYVVYVQNIKTVSELGTAFIQLQNVQYKDNENKEIDIKRQAIYEPKKKKVRQLQQSFYDFVIYVPSQYKNTKNIYRAGTFMKYFISENNKRLWEDSLLTGFDEYIYDENLDITMERFKKMNMSYLLIDLNAATIDQDPGKRLTQRYTNMLQFMNHKDLKLIDSDSVCLKTGREFYRTKKDMNLYTQVAGINYGTATEKEKKKIACIGLVHALYKADQINANQYPYLMRYKNLLDTFTQAEEERTQQEIYIYLHKNIHHGFKALFEVID